MRRALHTALLLLLPSIAQTQALQYSWPDWTICGGDCGASTWMTLQPVEIGAPPWRMTQHLFPNYGSSRPNHVINFGWNMDAGGGRFVPGETASGWSFESFYAPTATDSYMESHLFFVSSAGVQFRPMAWGFHRTTNRIEGILTAHRLDVRTPGDDRPVVVFGPNYMEFGQLRQIHLLAGFNNQVWLSQLNAAHNAYVSILYVDSDDRLRIAPGGHTTSFGGKVQLGEGPTWQSGNGVPTVACSRGSLFSRLDASPALYVCESTDTWVAK